MGFRSTLISDHWGGSLPQWFKDRYSGYIDCPSSMMIASTCESKLYGGQELFKDYQRALIETGFFPCTFPVTVVVLAEDCTITKVTIEQDKITYTLMQDWYETGGCWDQ